ncbi:MAG TPA: hypothetical protein PK331_12165 [Gordonia sp. (in: high G+C Gram-positive bacteria)]|uniref:hypothetical protein n=1 Tax=unclassified Gordonia (in: high G+C Gram-positive bacteria) TaxID=2657482 RepID=UPI000FC3141D|nr:MULTISPECIES: hypothetical protein [unclassified Gordonia (in: high G+C Gram-positive bacteria)]RUP39861.1 MAG: hypothetical protein EKK60_05645 [Gordonia sp. (in: high G+C Gram-positive bacteria)]HNP56710.1 hypothetical protein [Gordonia sp. (in: high G+C Gram-positive bacteria)]HRC51659.1 hypothetical protein [Gordonia sp. (in: high G+C Gram-positive bacteria)]
MACCSVLVSFFSWLLRFRAPDCPSTQQVSARRIRRQRITVTALVAAELTLGWFIATRFGDRIMGGHHMGHGGHGSSFDLASSHLAYMAGIEAFAVALPLACALALPLRRPLPNRFAVPMMLVGSIGSAVTLWYWHLGAAAATALHDHVVAWAGSLFIFGALLWVGIAHAAPQLRRARLTALAIPMQAGAALALALMFLPGVSGVMRIDLVAAGLLMLAVDAIALLVLMRYLGAAHDPLLNDFDLREHAAIAA